jgi:hypothetical protein
LTLYSGWIDFNSIGFDLGVMSISNPPMFDNPKNAKRNVKAGCSIRMSVIL